MKYIFLGNQRSTVPALVGSNSTITDNNQPVLVFTLSWMCKKPRNLINGIGAGDYLLKLYKNVYITKYQLEEPQILEIISDCKTQMIPGTQEATLTGAYFGAEATKNECN